MSSIVKLSLYVLDVPAEGLIRRIQLHIRWERHWNVTSSHSSRSTSGHLWLKGLPYSFYVAKQRHAGGWM